MSTGPDWPRLSRDEQAATDARTSRWLARKEHREAGGKTLTLAELAAAIKAARAEARATEPGAARAAILLRVADMAHELAWHEFWGDDVTDWPDDPEWLGAPAS